ncbi:MAG: metallophosphoesterase [Clostridia bacterium]|nr:metallophosphoesterase [Clostridia bacterium]
MRIFKFFLTIILIAGLLVGYAFKVEPFRLVTEELELESPFVPAGTKVAVISDVHLKEDFGTKYLRTAVNKVNGHKPDAVLFLGDLFDNYETWEGDDNEVITALANIKADIKLCVYGNHDYGGKAQWAYKDVMEKAGFTILRNEDVMTELGIRFYGADDYIFGEKAERFSFDGNSFDFALAHVPASVENVENYDIFVAGHSHGGQVKIPFVEPFWVPNGTLNYYGGEYEQEDGSLIYINRGIGTSVLTVRFGAVPEITICKFS